MASARQPWRMGLELDPFTRMRSGNKLVEFRLNKPKWQDITVGDIIEFQCEPKREEILRTEVVEVMRHRTFSELFDYCEQQGYLEHDQGKKEKLQRLESRYSIVEQNKYDGVLGIRIMVLTNKD